MKRKKIIVVIIIIILFLAFIARQFIPLYSLIMRGNWGISLPATAFCTEVYEKDSGSSFHGDGIRYHMHPDYENCVTWYDSQEDNSEIVIFWDKNEKKLYVIESFI